MTGLNRFGSVNGTRFLDRFGSDIENSRFNIGRFGLGPGSVSVQGLEPVRTDRMPALFKGALDVVNFLLIVALNIVKEIILLCKGEYAILYQFWSMTSQVVLHFSVFHSFD